MKKQLIAALFATTVAFAAPTFATEPQVYSADTELGMLLENPEAAAVIEKYFPGLAKADGISMASAMTLRDLQQFKPELFTDKVLQDTDADLKKIQIK